MPQAIREHWSIENGLHYKLDAGMREDQCPIYRGFADRNLSIMRKIVLKLLIDEKTNTQGIALKRIRAALSVKYIKKSDRFLNFDEIALGRPSMIFDP